MSLCLTNPKRQVGLRPVLDDCAIVLLIGQIKMRLGSRTSVIERHTDLLRLGSQMASTMPVALAESSTVGIDLRSISSGSCEKQQQDQQQQQQPDAFFTLRAQSGLRLGQHLWVSGVFLLAHLAEVSPRPPHRQRSSLTPHTVH